MPVWKKIKQIWLGALLLSLALTAQAGQQDIRLVVDISGSMRWTDPNNLRIPATKMLIDLLPQGSQAGVWTFARQVNMLVPHGEVDDDWRKFAREEAKKISSVGLFTHIDRAIETVTWDAGWNTGKDRHVILLSDGLVDISEAETERERSRENQASRDHLLRERLPRLVDAGYTIHTLALSDEADHDLMATLAQRTGGLHAIAYEAEDLMPLLLQILNRMVDSEQVPLVGNRFSIDPLINEFTLLAFHQEGAEVALTSPEGERLTAASSRSGVRWHANSSYTQVTVERPSSGDWHLETDAHPDNRVTVVSDLKLQVSNFPATVYRGFTDQQQHLRAWLTEDGRKIDRREFLRLLGVDLRHHKGDLLFTEASMQLDGGRFEFAGQLSDFSELGEQQVTVVVDGQTFRRQVTQSFNVQDVVAANLQLPEDGGAARVILRAQHPDLDPAEIGFTVTANRQSVPVRYRGDGEWVAELRNLPQADEYRIEVEADGELRGERLQVQLPTLFLEAGSVRSGDRVDEPAEETPVSPAPVTEEETLPDFVEPIAPRIQPPAPEARPAPAQVEPEPEAAAIETVAEPETPESAAEPSLFALDFSPIRSWDDPRMLWVYLALGLANILLFSIAFIMYRRFIKRRQQRHDARRHDDEEMPDVDDLEFDLDDELDPEK